MSTAEIGEKLSQNPQLTASQEERGRQLGNFISAVELLGDLLMACKVFSLRGSPCR